MRVSMSTNADGHDVITIRGDTDVGGHALFELTFCHADPARANVKFMIDAPPLEIDEAATKRSGWITYQAPKSDAPRLD